MAFISPSRHLSFCNKLREQAGRWLEESGIDQQESLLLLKDIDTLEGVFQQYKELLKDVQELIVQYDAQEKTCKKNFRKKQLELKWEQRMKKQNRTLVLKGSF
jgi:late competence protein required for DNA uptake (superfamily II DNA/RNA helicase)